MNRSKENRYSLLKLFIVILFFLAVTFCTREEIPEEEFISPGQITSNSASLYWITALTNTENFFMEIYLQDSLVTKLENEWFYKFTNLEESTFYSGKLIAKDLENKEIYTASFSFTTLKNKAPEGEFIVNISRVTGNSIDLSWSQLYDPDGDSLKIDLILNQLLVAENLTESNYTVNGLNPLTNHYLDVVLKDNHGHEIKESIQFKSQAKGSELKYISGEFGDYKREYGVYIPSNIVSEKLPLVISLHGYGGFIWPGMIKNHFVTLAETEKFICLMPQGSLNEFEDPRWTEEDERDFIFIDQLMDTMLIRYNVDPERIYLSGMSNGAFMTYILAKRFEDRLAAIAPIAGTLGYSNYSNYTLKKPMPLCHIHGTADDIVQVEGNATHVSFEKILEFWIPHNNVNPEPRTTEIPDIFTYDNSTVTKFEYYTINTSSADIFYYQINNGGHAVPGIDTYSNHDINAYDEIWKFFKNRKLSDK